MARAIWTGSLSFGLVNVPVGLYSATEDHTIHFNQFEAGTTDRVRQRRVNERTGEEVEWGKVVKGYDLGGGEYVLINDDELEAVAPGPSRTIDITDFVDVSEIDPIFYQRSYYLAPHTEAAKHAYGLLLQAMLDAGRIGIANFVMRGKQYLVAIRPLADVIGLETMHFADEVRDPVQDIDGLPLEEKFSDREIEIAKLLIDSMTTNFEADHYEDTYRRRVMELIEQKRNGEVVAIEATPPPAPVVDLMEALRASVEAAKARGVGKTTSTGVAAATAPAASVAKGKRATGTAAAAPAAKSATTSESLETLSKADLLARAAKLGIAGRTKMTREALIDALGGAESTASPRRQSKAASARQAS